LSVTSIDEAKRKKKRAFFPGGEWAKGLIPTEGGGVRKCLANVLHVLSKHPKWEGVIAYDAFGECVVKLIPPPVREQDGPSLPGEWTEADSTRTAAWFMVTVGFEPATMHVDQAVVAIAERTVFHPVRDYLSDLKWDGSGRLDTMLVDYFGAADSPYTRAVGAKWMVSAVARVMRPGCKADHMLVLESPLQGIGKSTALRILASDPWFSDTGIIIGDKDSYQALRRKWIFEFAELSSIKGRDVERVKTFLSSCADTYRPSYGRRTRDFPRQTVFAGSTNETHYLTDPTGARRFWPVRCKSIDLEGLRRDRDQLWAEARVRYDAGAPWHLETADLCVEAAAMQEERAERDDWIDIVADWLKAPTMPAGERSREPLDSTLGFTTADVLIGALKFTPDKISMQATKRAGHVLRVLGYEPRRPRGSGNRARRYFMVQVDQVESPDPDHSNEHVSCDGPRGPGGPGQAYMYERDSNKGNSGTNWKSRGPGGPPGPDDVEREAIRAEGEAAE
jgi:virulence-associated protein E